MLTAGSHMAGRSLFRRGDRLFLLCVCIAAYGCAMWLRLLELPYWSHRGLKVDGEYILGTHDAYAWLAGVIGVGTGAGTAPADFLKLSAELLGVAPATAAFWLPVILGACVAPLCCLCAYLVWSRTAAVAAGMLGACGPAFVHRTRLGFYDTDVVLLLAPLAATALMLAWLGPLVREIGKRKVPGACGWRLVLPMAGGGVFALTHGWHSGLGAFFTATLAVGVLVGTVLTVPGRRTEILAGLTVFCAAGGLGLSGLVVGGGLVLAARGGLLERTGRRGVWTTVLLLLLVAALTPQVRGAVGTVQDKVLRYAGDVIEYRESVDSAAQRLAVYPGVVQSVVEAKKLDPIAVTGMISGHPVATWLGLAGLALCIILRPWAALLLPFACLPFLSEMVGGRVLMFGGPPVAVGIGVLADVVAGVAARRNKAKRVVGLVVQCLVAGALLVPLYKEYSAFRPAPVITKQAAQALEALGNTARADSRLWIWWDWGYAAQYYSGLASFADGARHSGEYLFPLGLVMTTPEPRQARQMMQYAALKGYAPWKIFDQREADEVWAFINSLVSADYDLDGLPPQYFVTTWESIAVSHWITYYGTWDVERATGIKGGLMRLRSKVSVAKDGSVELPDGKTVRLASLDVLGKSGVTRRQWEGDRTVHMLVNELNGRMLLVGDITYNGMLVQLMMAPKSDPELSDDFNLVYDGFPFVRIWRARDASRQQAVQQQ